MNDEEIDIVFKAIAHPERRHILASLYKRSGQSLFEICASSLAEAGQPLSRQTISQHLDMLERAGLIEVTWMGRTKTHSANLSPLREAVKAALGAYLEEK
ncbi:MULTISPECIES: ArsR/SmtB family transcription factor [Rhizobium]|uniref:Helix-turn-helix transcriptional regulator n=1 Tax=Rhizobium bangladeshense TaxID=1138189 RepID=A0ABS7LIA0_9HYPH|nr:MULTISPECIES: winged helix-turn-helix domain-containing protein [Rhizobium]MBX4867191.1 helix-turn-helix transcriptional regulator [Rhizobium bangladeshense]MBX4871482.1 helix-turn-helix transcriptional regulator [Rhizobium bangladeshense]MBX4882796.1 helix-turn-helix transcriptional regulator [Rhizobium bangladeshense]MBX4891187.1 helix-turn-helix transcriptional regulator [Rhizobium bangladeshense]MBX4897035.1 helix-turn-helix transcriptional regulator [Rhizobium bangladeshense]